MMLINFFLKCSYVKTSDSGNVSSSEIEVLGNGTYDSDASCSGVKDLPYDDISDESESENDENSKKIEEINILKKQKKIPITLYSTESTSQKVTTPSTYQKVIIDDKKTNQDNPIEVIDPETLAEKSKKEGKDTDK